MSQVTHFPALSATLSLTAESTPGSTAPSKALYVGGTDGTNLRGISTDSSGKVNVLLSGTVPLPTGAATAALQTTGNSSLSSIDTKTPALGQALAAASVPVVLTAAQLTTLTPLATVAATQSGTWNITNVSGSISLPTGASTAALQTTGNTRLSNIDSKIPANLTVTATRLLVDGSGVTQPISMVPLSSSTNANSSAASTVLASSLVIKASAGRLYQLTGVNTKASAQYIQVFNNASVPADTTVPILLAYVPALSNFSFDFGAIGRYFSTGITVTNSSSAATKTIGSADCWFNAEYL